MRIERHRERRPWSAQEDDDLKRLAKIEGQTSATIARILNRTAASVSSRLHSLGIRTSGSRKSKDPLDAILFNGEPLQFAEIDRPCARCAVRETIHDQHGCGQFAIEIKVRTR